VYEIRFDEGETITLEVRDGELTAAKLPATEPTLSVELAPDTLHAMTEGLLAVEAAVAERRARVVVGSSKELAQLIAMFARSDALVSAAAA
jgi:hypothetical protein